MINLVFLFSGVGRLDLAFEQVGGLGNSLVVECERAFFGSLVANICQNRPSQQVICADFRALNPSDYFDNMEHPIGVFGGPPCETFSSMGGRSTTKKILSRKM
jgi:site-specific DNA-cytosine methylase